MNSGVPGPSPEKMGFAYPGMIKAIRMNHEVCFSAVLV
jgi:hypothetical protein